MDPTPVDHFHNPFVEREVKLFPSPLKLSSSITIMFQVQSLELVWDDSTGKRSQRQRKKQGGRGGRRRKKGK